MSQAQVAINQAEQAGLDVTGYPYWRYRDGYIERAFNEERVQAAIDWLADKPRTKNVNCSQRTSYGLKHIMERQTGTYVMNGEFLAAALFLGFKLRRVQDTPNGHLNISSKVRG